MSCQIDVDYDCCGPEFATNKIVKAQKKYACCECGDPIIKGQKYESVSGKWEGEFRTYRTCLACAQIRKDFFCSWVYGEMRTDFWEQMGYDYIDGDEDEN